MSDDAPDFCDGEDGEDGDDEEDEIPEATAPEATASVQANETAPEANTRSRGEQYNALQELQELKELPQQQQPKRCSADILAEMQELQKEDMQRHGRFALLQGMRTHIKTKHGEEKMAFENARLDTKRKLEATHREKTRVKQLKSEAAPRGVAGSEVAESRSPSRPPLKRRRQKESTRRRSRSGRSRGVTLMSRSRSARRRKLRLTERTPSPIGMELNQKTNTLVICALKEGIVHRAAICGQAGSSSDYQPFDNQMTPLPVPRNSPEPLPASVGIGNLMIATWAIGRDCKPADLADKLASAPWDLIVLPMSSAVSENDEIHKYLIELNKIDSLRNSRFNDPWLLLAADTDVLQEKTIRRLSPTMFIALHKAKCKTAIFTAFHPRSRGHDGGVHFGTLKLTLEVDKQRMDGVKVGIVDVRAEVTPDDVHAVVAWAVLGRHDMMTGFFGNYTNTPAFVTELATRSNAISFTPMYQSIRGPHGALVHPTWWIFYAYYKKIQTPEFPAEVSENTLNLGQDIWDDMLPWDTTPVWALNHWGSPWIRHIGTIKMKKPDWSKWFDGCFQTVMWLGTATPSHRSQAKQAERAKRSGARNGKGKGKGKGEGEGKGKCNGATASLTAVAAQHHEPQQSLGQWMFDL